jgi:hypothetical protein
LEVSSKSRCAAGESHRDECDGAGYERYVEHWTSARGKPHSDTDQQSHRRRRDLQLERAHQVTSPES